MIKREYKVVYPDPRIIPLDQFPAHTKDISGQTFGRLTALGKVETPSNTVSPHSYWLFNCSCGGEKITTLNRVVPPKNSWKKTGQIKSCGCLQKEQKEKWANQEPRPQRSPKVRTSLEINGETKFMSEWAKEYHLPQHTLHQRMKAGITGMNLLAPIRHYRSTTVIPGYGVTQAG